MRAFAFGIVSLASLASTGALAADLVASDECTGPCLEYAGTIDLRGGWLFPSDGSIDQSSLVDVKSENHFTLKATEGLSFTTNIVSESVEDPDPGKDSFFANTGTYVDVLQAQYDFENFSIWGGKIHPAFGRAWDITPGIHGVDLAESYELAERLGGGVSIGFDAGGMSNRLQASAFTVDRTILSESLFTNRGRKSLSDGGAGNTSGVSSFAVALDGCAGAPTDSCYDEGSFGYQIAARYQKGGVGSDADEVGFLGSLNKAISLSDETTLRLFAEAAWFNHYDGSSDNALAVTGSAALEVGPATYSLAYSQLRQLVSAGADTSEYLVDATAMYDLGESLSLIGERWSIGAGYSIDGADGETVQTVGLRLTSELGGSLPLAN